MSLGLLGFVVPYFSGALRHAHIYFFAMVATFVAGCILAMRPKRQPTQLSGL
jgi:hypothetical protein